MSIPEPTLTTENMVTQDEKATKFRQNTIWISLIVGIFLTLVSLGSYIATTANTQNNFIGILITSVVALVAFWCAWIASRGNYARASSALIGTILIAGPLLPIVAKGQGIQIALISTILVSIISSATTTSQSAWRFRLGAIVSSLILIFVDLFLPFTAIPTDPTYSTIIALVLSIGYAIYIALNFSRYSLQAKITITFIGVTVIPLLVLGFYGNFTSNQILSQQAESDLQEISRLISDKISDFITNQLDAIRVEAQTNDIVQLLNVAPRLRAGSELEKKASEILNIYARKDIIFIRSYAILDIDGNVILDTKAENIGKNEIDLDYFAQTLKLGSPLISQVLFTNPNEADFYISAPVRNKAGLIIGVLRIRYNALILQNLTNKTINENSDNQNITIVDRPTFLRIADTSNPKALYQPYLAYTAAEIQQLQSVYLLPKNIIEIEPQFTSPELVNALRDLDKNPVFYISSGAENVIYAGQAIRNTEWIVLTHIEESIALSPANDQTRLQILVSLILITLVAFAAINAGRSLSNPLVRLREAAAAVTAGDLNARAPVTSTDEVGALATAFNTMTEQLGETLINLEKRINERTLELSEASDRSEIRAKELETISDVSRAIASEQNLQQLLPLIAKQVSEQFGYYHVGIFLIDEDNQFAVLQASNSIGGQRMLERGHKLEVGLFGIVGRVAQTGKARIALDVGEDAAYFNNPDLPETHSEIALPLNLRGKTIGVLDVQSLQTNAFSEDSISTLSVLADQITIAIENARLFSSTEKALAEVQSLYTQYLKTEWQSISSKKQVRGYHHTISGSKELNESATEEKLKKLLLSNEIILENEIVDGKEFPVMTVPIKVRSQLIGYLKAKSPTMNKDWSVDEIRVARSVSERVALALENARLFEESQRRASKERVIGEISAKISAAANVDNILQIAVEELGRTLQGSQVAIRLDVEQNNTIEEDK